MTGTVPRYKIIFFLYRKTYILHGYMCGMLGCPRHSLTHIKPPSLLPEGNNKIKLVI